MQPDYTGPAMRVRRSADNAELDIPLATAPQTRTNLAAIPANNAGGQTTAGVTMTTLGTGVEFGQPYVDVRWQGTATAAGFAQFVHSATATFNPAIHAPVSDGFVYTASVGARLIAGTVPVGAWAFRGLCRSAAASVTVNQTLTVPAPTAAYTRYASTFLASGGSAYCQPTLYVTIALNEVVDFTVRVYAVNVELGTGNLRPLLLRDTPEVVAAFGDLDVETLAHFVGGENLLTWSDDVSNAAWVAAGISSRTATDIVEDAAAATQHRLSRSISLGPRAITVSARVQRGVGTRQFQFGITGTGLVARAYFDLGAGTVGATDQCTAAITALSGGEFLVSMTVTVVTAGVHTVFYAMANGVTLGSETYTGDGTSSLIIRNAQLRQGQLGTYNGTTSVAIAQAVAHNGFISTWYEQSGNARNMTQATGPNQPQIVVGGAVTTELGRVSVQVPSTGFIENNFGTISQPNTRSYVITRRDNVATGSNGHYVGNFNSSPNTTEYAVAAGTINQYAGGTPNPQTVHPFVLGETAVFTSIYNNAVGSSLSKNGAVLTAPAGSPGTFAINGVRIGANSGSTTGPFAVSEVIVFASALSTADRQALERNQGQYYEIAVA